MASILSTARLMDKLPLPCTYLRDEICQVEVHKGRTCAFAVCRSGGVFLTSQSRCLISVTSYPSELPQGSAH
jgi:hypothetical protein